ncbi:phage integrase family protein [Rhizobacter sp. P5_C2]
MKTRQATNQEGEVGFPSADELAALRGWYAGLPAREAVVRYLGQRRATGQSSRSMLSTVRRQLARFALDRQRQDLAELFAHPAAQRTRRARSILAAIDGLRFLSIPDPKLTDDVAAWLPPRVAAALHRHGITTLADLTLRVQRRRRWWVEVGGLGAIGAARVTAFFAGHPQLTERSRALIVVERPDVAPWEHLLVPAEVDGSQGTFRAPQATSTLRANNDYQAVQAWLSLQESSATQRAYRKEAERLMLWAILERGKALSSLTTEDAVAYRQFLRRPLPRDRWVGPARPRSSSEWRPFQGALSPRSAAYALSVINALFRWLVEQRYSLANPFAGVKVKGARRVNALDATRAFTDHDWSLTRGAADGIEWTEDWTEEGAQRLRFVLDFWYATGLRPQELAAARLGQLQRDDHGDDWLHVLGKGQKEGQVSVPLFAVAALERYLAARGLPVTRVRWDPTTPLVPNLEEAGVGITASRLRVMLQRFFCQVAEQMHAASPVTSEKLRRATPHWMRHTHASHALANGAELTTVRDNLRHASVSTTSVYLHTDRTTRARQMGQAFPFDRHK